MNFYDKDWTYIGTKNSLTAQTKRITCISSAYLTNALPIHFLLEPPHPLTCPTPMPEHQHRHQLTYNTGCASELGNGPTTSTFRQAQHCAWPGSRVTTRPNPEFQQRAGRPGSGNAGCGLASIQRSGEACDTLPMLGSATKKTIILNSI
jgi:hypothetical protein